MLRFVFFKSSCVFFREIEKNTTHLKKYAPRKMEQKNRIFFFTFKMVLKSFLNEFETKKNFF